VKLSKRYSEFIVEISTVWVLGNGG